MTIVTAFGSIRHENVFALLAYRMVRFYVPTVYGKNRIHKTSAVHPLFQSNASITKK